MDKAITQSEIDKCKLDFHLRGGVLEYDGNEPKTKRKAFAISLAKWHILETLDNLGIEVDDDGSGWTCGLCMKFYDDSKDDGFRCCGRPIEQYTGKQECHGTPFWDYEDNSGDRAYHARREIKLLEKVAAKHFGSE